MSPEQRQTRSRLTVDEVASIYDLQPFQREILERSLFPYRWRVRTRLPERFGQRCRVLCRGAMNSCAVEFTDGHRVVTSRWYLRKCERLPSE